jgi:hypothetical protein
MERMTLAATNSHIIGAAEGISAVDKLVLSTVNAPYKRDISVAVLEECIVKAKMDAWPVHVATFFTDVAPFLIFGFASAHGISKSKLAAAYLAMKAKTGEQNPDLEAELVPLAPSPR